MRQIIFSVLILCSFALVGQRASVQTAIMSGDTVLYKATYHDVYTFDDIDSVYVLDTTIMLHFDAEYPRPFPDTIEHALTFANGVTRTLNFVRNDLITGKSGGQTVVGGTASGDDLTISSTTNGTKGNINFGTSTYDEVNNKLGIGITNPSQSLTVSSPTTYEGILVKGNVAPNISFVQNAGTTPAYKVGLSGNDGTALSISSGAGATDLVHIKSDGKVGIGTTNIAQGASAAGTSATSSKGSGAAHNNLQPYIVVYMFKRTS